MKAMVLGLGLAAVLAAVIGLSLGVSPNEVQAQSGPAAPANVRAANGDTPGQAVVRWDAVADAAYYRIGWVNMETFRAVQAEGGREWLDVFAFHDVVNRGQTVQTLSDLAPGVEYAFTMASVGQRFSNAAGWSGWTYLTTSEATSCPAPTGTGDYDADKDGLIEISNLDQLAAIRTDLDGDGVSSVPAAYAIAFPNAMPRMGCPNAGCTGYELVADLDFDTNDSGAADAGDAYWNNGAGWIPIGDSNRRFTADFDGNNNTIANLYINRGGAYSVGLFGAVSGGSVRQVGLVSATVSGDRNVGGLVGNNSGSTISGSYATGSVSGDVVGGLVGRSSGTISGSYATGSVSGNDFVGGLLGVNTGIISGNYATGSVSGDSWIGGLVGSNIGTISGSYATGSVSGRTWTGGLVGFSNGTISDSYAMGSVSGRTWTGGLVGSNYTGTITNSYAAGRVSSQEGYDPGGLVGYDKGDAITASYWDTQTSGQAGSYGGVGKTTAELQSPTTNSGIYADWDASVWDFGNSRQYPALKYQGMDVAAQRR